MLVSDGHSCPSLLTLPLILPLKLRRSAGTLLSPALGRSTSPLSPSRPSVPTVASGATPAGFLPLLDRIFSSISLIAFSASLRLATLVDRFDIPPSCHNAATCYCPASTPAGFLPCVTRPEPAALPHSQILLRPIRRWEHWPLITDR